MISNIVISINAGFTKFVGEIINKSFEIPKTKKKIVNLEDLKKVQSVPQVSESKKENREYNGCGRYINDRSKRANREYDNSGRHLDILSN